MLFGSTWYAYLSLGKFCVVLALYGMPTSTMDVPVINTGMFLCVQVAEARMNSDPAAASAMETLAAMLLPKMPNMKSADSIAAALDLFVVGPNWPER